MTDAPDALQGPLHAALEALAPLAHLAAAGGLRALPAAPRDGQTGGGDPQAAVDRLHATGEAARARAVWERLQRIPQAQRRVLEWLADRGEARPSVREAAVLLAREGAPLALRAEADKARAGREAAERAHGTALRRSRRLLTDDVATRRDLLTQRQREEERAQGGLAAWGRAALLLALDAWEATEINARAA